MKTEKSPNPQSSEMTDTSNNSIFSESMENPTNPEVQPIAEHNDNAQPKTSRSTAKQRKSDLEDYRKAYFGLIKLGKDNKHQVAISNDRFDRVERIARFFGGPGYSVSNFVEHIIQHLAFAFDKTESDDPHIVKVNGLPLAQQEPDVTCIRLY